MSKEEKKNELMGWVDKLKKPGGKYKFEK